MINCNICSKKLENNKGLSYHVSQIHNMKFCDYLVETELDGKWPVCSCGCGEKVNFFGGKFAKHVGSHGVIGLKRSEETRRKISKIQKGKTLSEDHKKKIAIGVRSRLDSDETIGEKISSSLTGKKKTIEHRKNISNSRKRLIETGDITINSEKISSTVTQRYLDGGFEWSVGQYASTKTNDVCNYRSSWELELMQILDRHPEVEYWKYEPVSIPYELEGKTKRYIPDFHVVTSSGKDVLIEVKPDNLRESKMNCEKRNAAIQFCERNGWTYLEWQSGENISFN